MSRKRGAFFLLLVVAATSGCTRVAAYQRGRLAHPTMDPDDGSSAGLEHVRAVEEGATGGHVGTASGCGCN